MTSDHPLYRLIGRVSLACEWLRAGPARPVAAPADDGGWPPFDKTGITVVAARPLPVLHDEADLLVVEYESLAHTIWRAQELSLFRRHAARVAAPLVDFGCGDGSFASALGLTPAYGVDNDPEALAIAEGYGIYGGLVRATPAGIPLPDGAAASVLSNSVLEHVVDLDAVLAEVRRILAPGGAFLFTVPLAGFARDLAKYFGARVSRSVNAEYHHRNLLDAEAWVRRLAARGFGVDTMIQYQPDWFTFWYRMLRLLGDRGIGRFVPGVRERVWRRHGPRLVEMVRVSIEATRDGGNAFVIARRPRAS